jgi:hypothetical protein
MTKPRSQTGLAAPRVDKLELFGRPDRVRWRINHRTFERSAEGVRIQRSRITYQG